MLLWTVIGEVVEEDHVVDWFVASADDGRWSIGREARHGMPTCFALGIDRGLADWVQASAKVTG